MYNSKYEEKINLISNLDHVPCCFLKNIYNSYIKLCSNGLINLNNLEPILNSNNCSMLEDITGVLDSFSNKEKLVLICFTNCINDRCINILSYCNKNNINVIFTGTSDLKSPNYIQLKNLNIGRVLKKSSRDILFFDFNISDINIPYSWDMQIKSNFESILNNLCLYSDEEIVKESNYISNKCLTCKKENVNRKIPQKINMIDIMKRLSFLLSKTYNAHSIGINSNNDLYISNLYLDNLDVENSSIAIETSTLIYALSLKDKKERASHIYDLICKKLEQDINDYNYCYFSQNKCIAQRDVFNKTSWPKNLENGCCYNIKEKHSCNHLQCQKCKIKSVSCRLFTCRYLKDRGIDYNIRKNLLVKCFFNNLQIPEFIWNFFKDKDYIMEKIYIFSKI